MTSRVAWEPVGEPLKKNAWHENSTLDTCDKVHMEKMKEIEKQTEGADEPMDAVPAV
jgi:hypothetical protein